MIITDNNGVQFNATGEQVKALETLQKAGNGRFISVIGYKPKTGYVKTPTIDYTLLSKFSIKRLYQRKIEALEAIEFGDIINDILNDEVLVDKTIAELVETFTARKQKELDSLTQSLAGELDNAHTDAHKRNYAHFGHGVSVNFVTEKVGKIQQPVLTNGLPTANAILVKGLTIQKKVVVEGERKVVNSGVPVRISNAINKQLNQKSVGIKQFSLKPENFKEVRLDSGVILTESLQELAE